MSTGESKFLGCGNLLIILGLNEVGKGGGAELSEESGGRFGGGVVALGDGYGDGSGGGEGEVGDDDEFTPRRSAEVTKAAR